MLILQKQFIGCKWLGKMYRQTQSTANSTCEDSEIDEQFATLLNQFRNYDDITIEDFITFNDNATTSPGQINTDLVEWREKAREEARECCT